MHRQLDVVRAAIAERPRTPFDIVPELVGGQASGQIAVSWGLAQALSYLDHLELLGEAERSDDGDQTWWSAVEPKRAAG